MVESAPGDHDKIWRQSEQPHPGTRIGSYRCSLPGLAGFTACRCEGTIRVTIGPLSRERDYPAYACYTQARTEDRTSNGGEASLASHACATLSGLQSTGIHNRENHEAALRSDIPLAPS